MKEWLKAQGISYRRLAASMGSSAATVCKKLNGETPWQQRDLLFFHDKFGLSSDFVLGLSSAADRGEGVMSNEVSCDSVARRVNGENPLDVLVGVSTPYGPLLTDDYGRPIRFAEYGDGPCRFGDRPIQVMKPYEWLADRVYVFDDEAVAPFKDDVARFVVEACRCFVGGDGDHDRSVVLCREGVAEQLDLSSDAFTPMVGSDGNAVSFSYQPCDRLRCVCSTNPQKGLGVFHVWTERGATYQAVLGPCAYERRPEKALTLPDELWSRNESWMRDFFEQETSDFLCLGVVSRRTNIRFVEGGSARG